MLSEFLLFAHKHKLFPKEGKILLAVSGGLDSIVMTDLFLKAEIKFGIAHCNFGLRAKESDLDEAFVKSLAKKIKVDFHTKKFGTEEYKVKNKISIQVAARDLRYEWFRQLLKKEDYACLATAHHLDDSIETFFINLLRGTGIKGLKGIAVQSPGLIRPLSSFQRGEILSYAKKEKLKWREDSSNSSEDYLRNRIRKHLSPLLLELQSEFPAIMLKNMEHLRQTEIIQQEFANILIKKYLKSKGENKWEVNISLLKKEEETSFKLQLILETLGIKATNISGILLNEEPGKIFHSGGFRILRDRTNLIIEKKAEASIILESFSGDDEEIQIENLSIRLQNRVNGPEVILSKSHNIQQVDASKLKTPLSLRVWQAGDFFYPLGMKQRKKVSDFLTDNKINRFEKEKCLVLLSGKDIVCILGHRIDDRFKVTDKTKNIYSISINKQ